MHTVSTYNLGLEQFWQTHKKWITYLKIVLAIFTIGFILYKLLVAYQIDIKFKSFQFDFSLNNILFLVLAIALLFLNWTLETIKWHLLINQFEKISFWGALKAVFSGVTLSIITPNQLGDFVGRIIHLKTLNKYKGSLVAVIGNTAQILVTAIFGMYALLAFLVKVDYGIYLIWKPIALFFFVMHVVAFIGFIRIDIVYKVLSRTKFFYKIEKYVVVFKSYSKSQLFKIFFISLIRYSVYLAQYVLLLYFFGVQLGVLNSFMAVIAIFCIQSIIPSFILIDIGLRGVSALFIFGELSNYNKEIELGVLLSAYSLWIINMLVPSLFGLYFILKHKFIK